MLKFVIKRILLSVFILFGVSVILYFLVRLMPVSYIENQYYASHPNVATDEDLRRVLALYGLERGIVEWLRTDQLTIGSVPVSAILSIIYITNAIQVSTVITTI